jgi:hypothetical protein
MLSVVVNNMSFPTAEFVGEGEPLFPRPHPSIRVCVILENCNNRRQPVFGSSNYIMLHNPRTSRGRNERGS